MSSNAELKWSKSSYSGTQGDSCVEVAGGPATVHVRDSKIPDSPQLGITPSAWLSFLHFATSAAVPGPGSSRP